MCRASLIRASQLLPALRSYPGPAWRALVLGLGVVLAQCAAAQGCEPPGPGTTAQALQLQLQRPACQKSSAWLGAAGSLFNQMGRYPDAADYLERALLLAPDQPQARLDYTIALAGQGDFASAAALAQALLAEPELPPAQREPLQRQLALWQDRLGQGANPGAATGTPGANPAAWQAGGSLAARLGFDTNLLGSPNLGSLVLTLGGQTQVLPLDNSYRAREGGYLRTDAQLLLRQQSASGTRWDLAASLRTRHSPGLPQATTTQYDISAERSQAPGATQGPHTYTAVAASGLDANTGSRYSSQGLAAGLDWHHSSACQLRLGLEQSWRSHPAETLLSGLYRGLTAAWACHPPGSSQWLLSAKAGQDSAQDPLRAGGNQAQASLRLAHYRPLALWGQSGALLADLELAATQDARGYSTLLSNAAVRNLQRTSARLELQRPLAPGWQWLVGTEWVQQQSSLPLFGLISWGPYTSINRHW